MSLDKMIGKTCIEIRGGTKYGEEMTFVFDDETSIKFYHSQNCCESVSIEDVVGDIEDLIDSPIVRAEERSACVNSCEEWTFYEFATNKGSVTVRWYGESNGYYSTDVSYQWY